MKTVNIPTCANPFVVIVNGIKYTYPAGATMEVPDDVAEVIEQHEEAKTEPAPVQPPYSGDDILAAAKAYTDKKVAEGGGSAPSSDNVIDLNAFGIDLMRYASTGGVVEFDIDHEAFWNSITQNSRFKMRVLYTDVIIMPSGFGYIQEASGKLTSVTLVFSMQTVQGVFARGTVQFSADINGNTLEYLGTSAIIITEMLTIPS